MNDDVLSLPDDIAPRCEVLPQKHEPTSPAIPAYLENTYWWAYLRPGSVWLFEREWLVNLILWGNMRRLTNAVLEEIHLGENESVLQVACVYGDFSNRLLKHLEPSRSRLHILDIAGIQLQNARKKLQHHTLVSLHHQDSSKLRFPTARYAQTVVFFLLHEQPENIRRATIAEAIRVTRPGGKVVFVDYHLPRRSNPLRYLMRPVLHWLEPFALDLWRVKLTDYLPPGLDPANIRTDYYCGGLYQRVVIDL